MSLFSRKSERDVDTSPGTNPRTGKPIRTEREAWNDFAADADRRAARADSKEGRKAMEKNARDFRRNARRS
ncbi:hypothetical protein QA942_19780 [Streptomyces sp. B21-106]|uniref:hypothetical protein n=1 Tax=Streptomyces sp. B21-106 TaxID=3039418 RepID=UPI002FF43942